MEPKLSIDSTYSMLESESGKPLSPTVTASAMSTRVHTLSKSNTHTKFRFLWYIIAGVLLCICIATFAFYEDENAAESVALSHDNRMVSQLLNHSNHTIHGISKQQHENSASTLPSNTVMKASDPFEKVKGNVVVNEPKGWTKDIASATIKEVGSNKQLKKQFEEITGNKGLDEIDDFVDGEIIDVLEHFFWERTNGISLELGALDGSTATRSMTVDLESRFGWKRILIEGNPMFAPLLRKNSPQAFGISAVVCDFPEQVHYSLTNYFGGIIELMSPEHIRKHRNDLYVGTSLSGNMSTVADWSAYSDIATVSCLPLSSLLLKTKTKHINYFLLDAEGAELSILHTIDWSSTVFDVITVETTPTERPLNYGQQVIDFLKLHHYSNVTRQIGPNIWFTRDGFVPSARSGISDTCYNGQKKSEVFERNWRLKKSDGYRKC